MECEDGFPDLGHVRPSPANAPVARHPEAVARRHLVPTRLEVLPFLCSLADILRHSMDTRIFIDVLVDRKCLAWVVDRRRLESVLQRLTQTSHWAAIHGGRLVLNATVGPAGGTLLDVFGTAKITNSAYGPVVPSPFFPGAGTSVLTNPELAAVVNFAESSGGFAQLAKGLWGGTSLALSLPTCVDG